MNNYRKTLSLLGIEITNKNDEQLLNQLPWDINNEEGFSNSFHQNLMQQLFAPKENLETRIIQMFRRTALSAAAAILVLFAMNFSQIKSIDNLVVTNEVSDWIESNTDYWWDDL